MDKLKHVIITKELKSGRVQLGWEFNDLAAAQAEAARLAEGLNRDAWNQPEHRFNVNVVSI